jgi:hypothetical protein
LKDFSLELGVLSKIRSKEIDGEFEENSTIFYFLELD